MSMEYLLKAKELIRQKELAWGRIKTIKIHNKLGVLKSDVLNILKEKNINAKEFDDFIFLRTCPIIDGKNGIYPVDFAQFCRKFEIRFEFVEVENEKKTNKKTI